MKPFVILALAVLCLQSNVLAANSTIATLTAQAPSQVVQVVDQKFEPIYGQVPYESSCSRQVPDHTYYECQTVYRQSCSGGGESCTTYNDSVCNSHGCISVPRRSCTSRPQSCHSYPDRVCSNRTIFRTEYYSCTRYRQEVVGQRLVKTFNHQVAVSLSDPSIAGTDKVLVSVIANEDQLSASLINSYPSAILNYAILNNGNADSNSVQNQSETITISRGLSAELVKKMNSAVADSLEMGREGFKFRLLNGAGLENSLKLKVRLVRTPAIWFNHTLYDDAISTSGFGLVSQGADIQAVVPYSKLGVDSISGLRHTLEVSVKLDAGTVLNIQDFAAEIQKEMPLSLEKQRPTF